MATATTKLGLIKPAGGEAINVDDLNANSDTIDKIMGGYQVADGVTPPNTDLYPGCLVYEKSSGWVWMAVPTGTGSYTKKYISWSAQASLDRDDGFAVPNQSITAQTNGNSFATSQDNWTTKGGTVSSNGCRLLAMPAVYYITCWGKWDPNGSGVRTIGWVQTNGANAFTSANFTRCNATSAGETVQEVSGYARMTETNTNAIFCPSFQQNSGVSLNIKYRFTIVLLYPL